MRNKIHFANAIMTNKTRIKGGHNLGYNLKEWKKNDAFYILRNISEYVNLV